MGTVRSLIVWLNVHACTAFVFNESRTTYISMYKYLTNATFDRNVYVIFHKLPGLFGELFILKQKYIITVPHPYYLT